MLFVFFGKIFANLLLQGSPPPNDRTLMRNACFTIPDTERMMKHPPLLRFDIDALLLLDNCSHHSLMVPSG